MTSEQFVRAVEIDSKIGEIKNLVHCINAHQDLQMHDYIIKEQGIIMKIRKVIEEYIKNLEEEFKEL